MQMNADFSQAPHAGEARAGDVVEHEPVTTLTEVTMLTMDRLGRSLADLIDTLRSLEAATVDLYLDQQAIDTTTPAGRMFFHVTGAFAEFERDMIRSRVNAGLARARARGVRLGRPKTSAKVERAIRTRLAAGAGILKRAKARATAASG
jgi:DNA invertase Pin-like site-specific DNA recombinase